VRRLQEMKLDSDVNGIIDIRPIRNTLQGVADTMSQFGGESFAIYSRIPDALQQVEVAFSFDGDDTFLAVAYIDDEALTKELAQLTNESLQSSNGAMAGGPLGLGGSGRNPRVIIEPTSTKLMEEVGNEIMESGLFSVTGKQKKLTVKLKRPSNFGGLIQALGHDAARQFSLGIRAGKLKKIAVAMKAYTEEHGCFPPAGVVSSEDQTLPPQFNWRVGLLPFLGEQELYDQFDFSKSWDSEENAAIAIKIPEVFASTEIVKSDAKNSQTRFHVVGQKLALYHDEGNPKLDDIKDKKIWTAVVIEGNPASNVEWTKPGSLGGESMDVSKFGNEDENGILFLNAAFKVRAIMRDQEKLTSILTIDGGETFTSKDFLPLGPME